MSFTLLKLLGMNSRNNSRMGQGKKGIMSRVVAA
jgi:hypothetical protein